MKVNVQHALESGQCHLPSDAQFEQWVELACRSCEPALVSIQIVDEQQSAHYNDVYRQKTGPTNILSFPYQAPEFFPDSDTLDKELGDLVVCAPLVEQEAKQQAKQILDHWAHLIVHGCLHLQGFDHIEEAQAQEMEQREEKLLSEIGIASPYQVKES